MKSSNVFPQRFSKVDGPLREDHSYLNESDNCYFIGQYTARRGFAYSATNQLIFNLKKSVDRRGRPEWRYKEEAIRTVAGVFRENLPGNALDRWTFVPVPPSQARTDPDYDDRMVQVLAAVRRDPPLDIRELVVQRQRTVPVHRGGERLRPAELESLYSIDEGSAYPPPSVLAIVDDMLTTGARFRAIDSILQRRFPEARIFGLFIARRVPETSEPDADQF